MRPEVEQQIQQIEAAIDINSLQVEGAQSVMNLIEVLEEKLFTNDGGTFASALHLYEDATKGIGNIEVARDKRKIALYEKIIHTAIDKIDELINTAELAEVFDGKLESTFPKKTEDTSEVVDKLTQLLSLLQSYLDLFKEWETGSNNEAPLNYKEATQKIATVEKKLNEILIGQEEAVRLVLIALFTGGHVLLESNSGLGKTKLAKSLGKILGLKSTRIQCTPDLMATDILGFSMHGAAGTKNADEFKKGPIFANIVLVDEINRATPKTQAALLEAMEERQVTNGRMRSLPRPFFVIATQNNHGSVGTYPLPEAQLDRFGFIVHLDLPELSVLNQIIGQTLVGENNEKHQQLANVKDVLAIQKTIESIAVSSKLIEYAGKILINTHPKKSTVASVQKYVEIGASVRGEHAIIRGAKARALLDNRTTVSIEDIQAFIRPALQHRISLNLDGMASSAVSVDKIIDDIIAETATP